MDRLTLIFTLFFLISCALIAQPGKTIIKDSLSTNKPNLPAGKDSVVTNDSTKTAKDSLKHKAEILIPIKTSTLFNHLEFNNTISDDEIRFTEYRNAVDLIGNFYPAFLRNLGMLGQPSELLLYGAGYDQVSYLKDGLLLNNRLINSFDLNNIQSESIDSIEIIPSVRGFLYGSTNNLSAINFISKENFSIEGKRGAYSRLRYYQSAYEEAFVDAIFSTNIYKKLTGHFEITNSTIGNSTSSDRFKNSEYGSWQGTATLRYPLSNKLNLVGNYNYINSQTHLFGGVDIDSLNKMTGEQTTEYQYPVNSLYRYYKNSEHNASLKVLHKSGSSLTGEATFCSRYSFLEYRDNEYASLTDTSRIVYNNKINVYGFSLTENYNADFLSMYFNSTYEKSILDTYYLGLNKKTNSFSVASKVSFLLADSTIIPSLFGKYLHQDSQNYFGIGGDVTYRFSKNTSAYAGLSYFQKPFGFITSSNLNGYFPSELGSNRSTNITSAELGMKFSKFNFSVCLNINYREIKDELNQTSGETGIIQYLPIDKYLLGANIGLNYTIWKLNLESSLSGYNLNYTIQSSSLSEGVTTINSYKHRRYVLPEYSFNGGIYYKEILFNNNLNLKTGIRISSVGLQQGYVNEFDKSNLWEYRTSERSGIFYTISVRPTITLDFILIGEIQNRATIYFSLENLLDRKYFIVNGYYMPRRYMKLGVAWQFLN